MCQDPPKNGDSSHGKVPPAPLQATFLCQPFGDIILSFPITRRQQGPLHQAPPSCHAENEVFSGMSGRKTMSHAENEVFPGTGKKQILSNPASLSIFCQYRAASGRPGVICGRKPVPDGAGEDKARFGCAGDDGSLNGEKSSVPMRGLSEAVRRGATKRPSSAA